MSEFNLGGAMAISEFQEDILKRNGYKFYFKRFIFINYETRKIFSYAVIEDKTDDWLQAHIDEVNTTHAWKFYFNDPPPSEELKKEIEKELEA